MNEINHQDINENFFRAILDIADMAVLVINHNFEITYANHYLCDRITGMPQSAMIGMHLPKHQTVPDEDLQRVIDSTKRVFEHGVAERIENWALHQDGSRRLMYWSSVPVRDSGGKVSHLLAVGMDVTEQRKEKQLLETLANRDALTGLHNRAFFDRRLPEDMVRAKHEGMGLALFYIDLDGFKSVNDQYGHETGDAVLREAALRLRKGLRQNDVICRIGGDEFAVILPGVSLCDLASKLAQQLIDQFSLPYEIQGCVYKIGASIGIAFLNKDTCNSQALVHSADTAMYQVKQSGKGRYCFAD